MGESTGEDATIPRSHARCEKDWGDLLKPLEDQTITISKRSRTVPRAVDKIRASAQKEIPEDEGDEGGVAFP